MINNDTKGKYFMDAEQKVDYIAKEKEVQSDSEKRNIRNVKIRLLKLALLICLLFLIIIYFLLRVWFGDGGFVIRLNRDFSKKNGIILQETLENPTYKFQLTAGDIKDLTNISINWLPNNLHEEADGSHNGENYLAYTFYLHNMGTNTVNYWYTIYVDDVINRVDTAIRLMLYRDNEERIVFAKQAAGGGTEPGTVQFESDEIVTSKEVKDFKPEDVNKFTIVMWVEGDDPECLDDLLGGMIKMHMDITEEVIVTQ